jgi:hypothetical protein
MANDESDPEFLMTDDESDESETNSSPAVEKCLDAVLRELDSDARFDLIDSRLQLAVLPFAFDTDPVWAYFPVHRRRRIAKFVELRPETRVLLVIFEPNVERLPYDQR